MAWNLPFVESGAMEVRMHEDTEDSGKSKAHCLDSFCQIL